MRLMILFILIFTIICYPSVCQDNLSRARILVYENNNPGLGRYNFKYETSDGIRRDEHGEISDSDSDNGILRVQGSYSYIAPDGIVYTVRYTADEQGYRPQISESTRSTNINTRIGKDTISSLQGGTIG